MEKSKSSEFVKVEAGIQNKNKGTAIKRTKALNILALILFFAYIALLCASIIFGWQLHKVWFSFFMGLTGIYLITRGLFFHLDSNYLLGMLLAGFSIISALQFFFVWPFFTPAYFMWAAITFFALYCIFRQNIYLILFALFAVEVLLLVINILFLNILFFATIQAIFIVVVFMVFISVTKIKKEKKGAVSNN